MTKKQVYWDYVLRVTEKEIESYKELYGDNYEGTPEEKFLTSRLDEAKKGLLN